MDPLLHASLHCINAASPTASPRCICHWAPSVVLPKFKFTSNLEVFLNAQQLVVFGHTVRAAGRACLNLSGIDSHRDIGNDGILLSHRNGGI